MNERITVEIDSLDLEGRGVGRVDGKVTFVTGALPGERVLCERTRRKPTYDAARLVEVQRSGGLRAAPRCPHFGFETGACGGCAMQHVQPRAQLAIKQRVLEDSLWHLARLRPDVVLRPIEGPAWGYRQRARLTVRDVAKKGEVLVGFHERASSYVADLRECHVVPASVSKLLVPLRRLVESLSVRRRLPQLELAMGAVEARSRTVLVVRHLDPLSAADLAALRAFAAAHGVSFWVQPGGPDSARPLDDDHRLELELPEFGVRIPFLPTDFTQVNHQINEVLVRRALRLLDPGPSDQVADFFCGLGNFTLPLARISHKVIGLEGSPALVQRAAAAAALNGLQGQAEFTSRNLFDWTVDDWQRLDERSGGITRVLLDPPREGALAVVRALAATTRRPQRLVYVSCNPATLARDCAVLVHEGQWTLKGAGVVNMFPHTAHVESIALLEPVREERVQGSHLSEHPAAPRHEASDARLAS